MIKSIICLLLFALTIMVANSQTMMIGRISDINNSEGIPFSKIELRNHDKLVEIFSDFEGNFKFDSLMFDSVELVITQIGYNNFDTTVVLSTTQMNLNIDLIPTKYSSEDLISVTMGFSEKNAIEDITNGKILIILPGGLLGSPELPNDSIFEKKYSIKFFSPGCGGTSGSLDYNLTIFNYLDEEYGKQWRNEIRTDAVGIKN